MKPVPRLSWDLQAPWGQVKSRLQSLFEGEKRRHNVETRTLKGTRFQKPKWAPVETWDLWDSANYDPGKFDLIKKQEQAAEKAGKEYSIFAVTFFRSLRQTQQTEDGKKKSTKNPDHN
ncbi:hypothetical protein N8766_06740 [bacterium]|nr:hypothetical protein [bacterium]